jgi:3-oxoacyl-[acyl-carrier protein] reductase
MNKSMGGMNGMFDLTGKTALVTGASGGIGAAIARVLHAQGATVGLHGTRADALEALASALGERAKVLPANLAHADEVEALAKAADVALGQVDILVNNAGITRDGLILRMKDEDWQTVLDVNLTAGFRLSRALLKGMLKRRWGRIIGIASVVGVTGNPGQVNYAASKAGMIGLTKALAQETASRNVTVNCVAPGMIGTPMTDALTQAQKDAMNARIPAGRLGTSEEIAAGVLYLASQEASYVTGQTLHINGGMAMI